MSSRTDEVFGERMFARMADSVVAAVRSWCEKGEEVRRWSGSFMLPHRQIPRLEAHLFRVTLLRLLHFPFPFTERSCKVCLPLDSVSHHRVARARGC